MTTDDGRRTTCPVPMSHVSLRSAGVTSVVMTRLSRLTRSPLPFGGRRSERDDDHYETGRRANRASLVQIATPVAISDASPSSMMDTGRVAPQAAGPPTRKLAQDIIRAASTDFARGAA